MLQILASDVKSELETLQDVSEQIQQADPDQVKEFFLGLVPQIIDFGVKVLLAFLVYFVGMRLIKFLRRLLRRFLERSGAEAGVKQFLDSLLRALLYFFLAMIILSWFGVPTASVVALLGSAGLTLGLAMQGSLSNFAGGVLILLIKPFKVGDYIIEDNQKNEGTVKEIQLFYTVLATVDNQLVIIPNGILSNCSLTNVTHQEKRRVDITVGVSYQADLKEVKRLLRNILEQEKRRLPEEELAVFVQELADSSVLMGCRLWVRTEDYWPVKWHLTEEVKCTLEANGVEIPYNRLEVSIKSGSAH